MYNEEWNERQWYFIKTVCHQYPNNPNKIIRKKYYEFMRNIPDFLPECKTNELYIKYSDMYPISSYLDSRTDLLKWYELMYINIDDNVEKDKVDEYVQKTVFTKENVKIGLIVMFLLILYYLLL